MLGLRNKLLTLNLIRFYRAAFSEFKKPGEQSQEEDLSQVKKFERRNKGQVEVPIQRRRVTKEDMKTEMLNDDHFDQDAIKDGMERREDREDFKITQAHFDKVKAADLPTMTKDEIESFVKELKGEDYKLMDI